MTENEPEYGPICIFFFFLFFSFYVWFVAAEVIYRLC